MKRTGEPHERRESDRLDIYRVIQFKPLKATAGYSLGISRNVSYEGLSFESQVVDIEPGEELELVFKNPKGSQDVSCRGSIIWKKESNKFKTFAGISFQNLNKIAKDNIMNVLSLGKDMFPETFSYREYPDRSVEQTNDTEAHKEASGYEPVNTPEEQVYCEETEDIHNDGYIDKSNIFKSDLIRDKNDHTSKILYSLIVASLVLTAIVIAVFVFWGKDKTDTGASSIVSTENASPPAAPIEQSVPLEAGDQNKTSEYSIQVGAWKNPDYAQEMLMKLKKYYAGAYMYKKNNFHFIKIKGISTQQQGADMIQDINKRFGLKPILIKPGQ
jgi:hypothetical protein